MGVKQIVVAVNKMDDPTVDFSEKRFTEIKYHLADYLKKIGYNLANVAFLPTSGLKGENLYMMALGMPWYRDKPNLLEALDNLEIPRRPVDKPLRIPLQDVYKIGGVGTVPVGKVEFG